MSADESPGPPRESGEAVSRRTLLAGLGAGLLALGTLLLAMPIVGSLAGGWLRRAAERKWVSLGTLDGFPERQTRLARFRNPLRVPWDGETAHIPCWVRRLEAERFQVFAINCTHLGCPVRWFSGSGLFMCPCHGGVFYEDGTRAAGPPQRRLYEYETRVRNGQLWIRAGRIPTPSRSA